MVLPVSGTCFHHINIVLRNDVERNSPVWVSKDGATVSASRSLVGSVSTHILFFNAEGEVDTILQGSGKHWL